ncbi:MAG: DUF3486 family protein [Pseudohongiella sp.]|nr:DUF3486 family protein [Pseudohongiella sp.]
MKAASLPADVRAALDVMLRANAYGKLEEASRWLSTKGHSIGRSSVHRYAMLLSDADQRAGIGIAALLDSRNANGGCGSMGNREAIFAELQRLQKEQSKLLSELESLAPG